MKENDSKLDLIRLEISNLNKSFQEHRQEDKKFKEESVKFFHETTELKVHVKNLTEKMDKVVDTYETHLDRCHRHVSECQKNIEQKFDTLDAETAKNTLFRVVAIKSIIGAVAVIFTAFVTGKFWWQWLKKLLI